MKIIGKVLKIIGISIAVVLLLMILLPIIFKGKIMEVAKEQINANVNAKVEFNDISLSIFRSFPDLNLRIDELSVIGKRGFENDTLVWFESFSIDLKTLSVLGNQIEVNKIALNRPIIRGIVKTDSTANWDIAVSSPLDTTSIAEEPTTETDSTAGATFVSLKRFEITNASIIYDDKSAGIYANLDNLNFGLSGDLSADFTSIQSELTIDAITAIEGGVAYLNKTKLGLTAIVDADLKNMKFTIQENTLALNQLLLKLTGWVAMPSDDIDMDLNIELAKMDFKSLLSLVPALYAKDFDGLKAEGKLALKVFAKGIYNEQSYPAFGANLIVENGMFQYPDLPKSIHDVNISIDVKNSHQSIDYINTNIKMFHFEMAENPFDLKMVVDMTPTDIALNGSIVGKIDLGSLTDIIPLDDTELSGSIATDIGINGKLSAIEKEEYEQFDAKGSMQINALKYKSTDFPDGLEIKKADIYFSPKALNLATFDLVMDKSDVSLKGKVENFIPYVFANGTVKGQLCLNSHFFDVNPFMVTDSTETTANADTISTATTTAFDVPGNIDFVFTSNMDKVLYDKLEITKLLGTITVKDKKVSLDNLKMNLLQGTMNLTGAYDTKDIAKPKADFSFGIEHFSIPETFNAFNTVRTIAPIAKYCDGFISTKFKLNTLLDNAMTPVYNSMNGDGFLGSDKIGIVNAPAFENIGGKLKSDKFANTSLKNLNMLFEIINGNIEIKPFDVLLGGQKATIKGSQNVDQSINYEINMQLAQAKALELLQKNTKQNLSAVDVVLKIGGTLANPKIVGFESNAVENVKNEVISKAKEEARKKADKLLAEADKQAKKLITEAESKANLIRQNAKKAGDKLVEESDFQGKKLIKEAGNNPIKKKLAEESAKKLKIEAQKKATKLVREANTQADQLVNTAKSESTKIKGKAKQESDKLLK